MSDPAEADVPMENADLPQEAADYRGMDADLPQDEVDDLVVDADMPQENHMAFVDLEEADAPPLSIPLLVEIVRHLREEANELFLGLDEIFRGTGEEGIGDPEDTQEEDRDLGEDEHEQSGHALEEAQQRYAEDAAASSAVEATGLEMHFQEHGLRIQEGSSNVQPEPVDDEHNISRAQDQVLVASSPSEEDRQPPEADAEQLLAFLINPSIELGLGRNLEIQTSASSSGSTVVDMDEDNHEHDGPPKPDWSQLPDMATIEIFGFLDEPDRMSIARTCKKWSQLVHTGALWRFQQYNLGQPGIDVKILGYAERHAKHLRYLVLDCSHPLYNSTKRIQKCMTTFFAQLHKKTKLRHFLMTELRMDRYWRYEISKSRFLTSLNRLLRNQRRLTKFDMTRAQVSMTNGFKILESLGTGSGAVLTYLDIQDFFHSRQAVHLMLSFPAIIDKFVNLRRLFINYNCLSDDIVSQIARNSKHRLNYIAVKVYKNDPHYHRIPARIWQQLVHFCPNIRIHFEFDHMSRYYDICPIVVQGMPLHGIQIWSGYEMDDQDRLANLINYIHSVFSSTLELAVLEFDNHDFFFDEELVTLVERCKKLKVLDVNSTLLVPTVERICKLQQEGKIALRKFHATLCNLTHVEYAELNFLEEYYQDMIKEGNLDFEFDTDVMFAEDIPEE